MYYQASVYILYDCSTIKMSKVTLFQFLALDGLKVGSEEVTHSIKFEVPKQYIIDSVTTFGGFATLSEKPASIGVIDAIAY